MQSLYLKISYLLQIISEELHKSCGPGQLSRYNDWLRAGRAGDRISVGVRFSAPVQTGPGAHPAPCTTGIGSFPAVKSGRGVTLTPHPILVPCSRKSTAIPPLPRLGRTACTQPQCLYKGASFPLSFFTQIPIFQGIKFAAQ